MFNTSYPSLPPIEPTPKELLKFVPVSETWETSGGTKYKVKPEFVFKPTRKQIRNWMAMVDAAVDIHTGIMTPAVGPMYYGPEGRVKSGRDLENVIDRDDVIGVVFAPESRKHVKGAVLDEKLGGVSKTNYTIISKNEERLKEVKKAFPHYTYESPSLNR